jgi:hypothetical protein
MTQRRFAFRTKPRLGALIAMVMLVMSLEASAGVTVGRYVLVSSNPARSGVLEITSTSAQAITLDLELEHSPASDRRNVRTGRLEQQTLPLNGDVAVYGWSPADAGHCLLVFVFSGTGQGVEISQFGECELFGVGVNATGRYVRRAIQGGSR